MSLLLTIGQGPISEICISKSLGTTWHPCNKKQEHSRHDIDAEKEASGHRRLLAFPESSYGQRRVLAAAGYDKCAAKARLFTSLRPNQKRILYNNSITSVYFLEFTIGQLEIATHMMKDNRSISEYGLAKIT